MKKWLIRLGFILLVMGAGLIMGRISAPGQWHADLVKPFFNPPNWIFAPVWTALYMMIAVAGWRQFESSRQGTGQGTGMRLWITQMGLNLLWSPVFFIWHQIWLGFVVIAMLWLTLGAFIAQNWSRDRLSALLFLPYLAWVSFATLLNLSIALLN